ncbi:hypothetical protein [Priestia endophytica]|uniref:Lipoprotein n=1 Tax=Priestia endophytica TaxID=135735 RepID=A0AAX1Q5R7_9BACI|nr:hypothetical protein [Priestia endophytica]RAS74455.1 hypothetical protein A3864_18570 [Priestia endophytica]
MFKYFCKSKWTFPILSLLLIIVLSGCGTVNKMEFYNDTKSTDLSEEVSEISLETTEDKVKKILGQPSFTEKSNDGKVTNLIYGQKKENPKIELQVSDGKVNRYFFLSEEYSSTKGITKGDSEEDVIKKYGENYYHRDETGLKIIGYFDKKKKCNIEFSLNDTVEGILVTKVD